MAVFWNVLRFEASGIPAVISAKRSTSTPRIGSASPASVSAGFMTMSTNVSRFLPRSSRIRLPPSPLRTASSYETMSAFMMRSASRLRAFSCVAASRAAGLKPITGRAAGRAGKTTLRFSSSTQVRTIAAWRSRTSSPVKTSLRTLAERTALATALSTEPVSDV